MRNVGTTPLVKSTADSAPKTTNDSPAQKRARQASRQLQVALECEERGGENMTASARTLHARAALGQSRIVNKWLKAGRCVLTPPAVRVAERCAGHTRPSVDVMRRGEDTMPY